MLRFRASLFILIIYINTYICLYIYILVGLSRMLESFHPLFVSRIQALASSLVGFTAIRRHVRRMPHAACPARRSGSGVCHFGFSCRKLAYFTCSTSLLLLLLLSPCLCGHLSVLCTVHCAGAPTLHFYRLNCVSGCEIQVIDLPVLAFSPP